MEKIRSLEISAFLLFFFFTYLTLNHFILSSFSTAFGPLRNSILYSISILLSVSFPLSLVLGQRYSHAIIKVIYRSSVIWFGMALLFLWGFIIRWFIQLWIEIPYKSSTVLIIILVIFISFYSLYRGYSLELRTI